MVDKDTIMKDLRKYFAYHGQIDIDDEGTVSCTGSVEFTARMKNLPVRFAQVDVHFKAALRGLTSLVGAPHTVGQQFICRGNPLTSWKGAPSKVGAEVYANNCKLTNLMGSPSCLELFVQGNPLSSLDGMPEGLKKIGFTFDSRLPVLKALQADQIALYAKESVDNQLEVTCYEILEKYAGQGRRGAFSAAKDLNNAGEQVQKEQGLDHNPFEANARW